MTQTQPPTTQQLVQMAGSSPARWQGIPRQACQSYPIPLFVDGELRLAFLFYRKLVAPPADPILSVPRYVMQVDRATAEVVGITKVQPDFFGLPAPEDGVLGVYKLAPKITVPIWHELRAQLFALYDRVLPAYDQGDAPEEQLLEEIRQAFLELAEQPLLPYYRAMGPDFFHWIQ